MDSKENKNKEINEKELKALVSLLDDEDYNIVYQIEQKIISLGNEMIPFLEHEWENSFNPHVQKKIEELIHQLQFDQLKSRLSDWKNKQGEDLLEGMWLVATFQYPDLDLLQLRKDLEQLFYDAWLEYKPNLHPYDQVKVLNGVIFSKLKFSSNTKNFHAPSNSMINVVMESKKGNPISLCVIYMLVAQKLNMPVYGVNLPNLFILTYKTPQMQFYINAFNKGLIFSRADIDNYIAQLHINPMEIFYEPCSHLDIVKRVLRNLIISYEKLDEHHKADEVKQLLLTISDEDKPF